MKPSLRVRSAADLPSSPELARIAPDGLDDLWDVMWSQELRRCSDPVEAERRVAERWKREDRLKLRDKIAFWEAFSRARARARWQATRGAWSAAWRCRCEAACGTAGTSIR